MADAVYMANRQKYKAGRPQAIVFANSYSNSGTNFVPDGVEFQDFIILSDHNRSEMQMDVERIEKRERMINGRMRSVWLEDKLKVSVSWKDLPSRAASSGLVIVDDIVLPADDPGAVPGTVFTVDSGAAAADLKKWHKDHPGSFWMLMSYDDPHEAGGYDKLIEYSVAIECFFADFKYEISKRGKRIDLWNVNLSVEEV